MHNAYYKQICWPTPSYSEINEMPIESVFEHVHHTVVYSTHAQLDPENPNSSINSSMSHSGRAPPPHTHTNHNSNPSPHCNFFKRNVIKNAYKMLDTRINKILFILELVYHMSKPNYLHVRRTENLVWTIAELSIGIRMTVSMHWN